MTYNERYERWMDSPALDEGSWEELKGIAGDKKEIESRFYSNLDFGTAGLRGIMGMGTNRMNVHVIRHATQAFAEVIDDEGGDAKSKGIAICYDCRNGSTEFARAAAEVMAGNGINVKIFDGLRPTPELSFAIRHYGCIAGINVTASHNPKEYNGYKVYWSDGAQLPPGHAGAVAKKMEELDVFTSIISMDFDRAMDKGLITYLGKETDDAFLNECFGQAMDREVVKKTAPHLKIVYTPFHGTGHQLVPEILSRIGIKHLIPVPEQMVIDGNFPTVESPNPENPEGFELGIKLADKEGADLIIGTDPDADRIGIMVRNTEGKFVTISGNQLGILLVDYVIGARRKMGTLPENAAFIKTIVTSEMAREVCEKNNVHMDETFTGFKFIAEKVHEFEQSGEYSFIMGFEESNGYMAGNFVRDKDAITASMLVAEMAASYFDKGMNLYDAMMSLYEKYGWFQERTLNLVMPGLDGLADMKKLMKKLRDNPPGEIADTKVIRVRDYLSGRMSVAGLGVVGQTPISGSNVLYFELTDGTSFIVRPSGTEPKIKIYILTRAESLAECQDKINKYVAYAETLN